MARNLFALVLGLVLSATAPARAADLENTLYLTLETGRVVIDMVPEKAPNHVARIKELVRQGFYDGLEFHRVSADHAAAGHTRQPLPCRPDPRHPRTSDDTLARERRR